MAQVFTEAGPVWVPYALKRSSRSRTIRLSYGTRGDFALLTVPDDISEADAMDFLKKQGDWLSRRMREYRPAKKLSEYLATKPWLCVDGRRAPLRLHINSGRPCVSTRPGSDAVFLRYDPLQDSEDQFKQALRDFAKDSLSARARELAGEHNIQYGRVSVRDQSTIWGSCSSKRNVSLNWRLLLLAPELQDYIILHELAHLKHMNHSRKFWELLSTYDERAILHDRRINGMSREIMRLGR